MSRYEEHAWQSADGLRLHAREYPCAAPRYAVLCLHGLTRNSADFDELADSLSDRYRFYALDQRGRGRSDADPKPENYHFLTYVADTFAFLDRLEIDDVAVIGTSMGGLMAMLMVAEQPHRIRGLVLNDVGPVVAPAGLARIQAYVGQGRPIRSWKDATDQARANNEIAFPDWGETEWRAFAEKLYVENEAGVPEAAYDPAISQPLNQDPASAAPPDLWPVFDAIAGTPTLLIRGATSDILSAETGQEMARRHPKLTRVEVPGRGHAPTLDEPVARSAIESFLASLV